jgi:hypothetical protein
MLKILLQPNPIHLNVCHAREHTLKLTVPDLNRVEHVSCDHQSFLHISCVWHSESRALAERHGQGVLANDANGSKLDLNRALPIVAIAQEQVFVCDVIANHANFFREPFVYSKNFST